MLGIVWTDGPLTRYAIRSAFLKSRSSHFSGSAGAIYPLIDRLKGLGLVHATRHKRGNRESQQFTITPAGKEALKKWLWEDKSGLAAVEFDPIRARVHFLGVLTPRQRERFIQDSIASLENEIGETEALIESRRRAGNKWSVLGAIGALRTLDARLAWLHEILESE